MSKVRFIGVDVHAHTIAIDFNKVGDVERGFEGLGRPRWRNQLRIA